jgi:hypothetical protein
MTVEELQPYLIKQYRELEMSIRGGWYKPAPVKRVEIPKPDGGETATGNTNGKRPDGTTGAGTNPATDIRADIFGQQLRVQAGAEGPIRG